MVAQVISENSTFKRPNWRNLVGSFFLRFTRHDTTMIQIGQFLLKFFLTLSY